MTCVIFPLFFCLLIYAWIKSVLCLTKLLLSYLQGFNKIVFNFIGKTNELKVGEVVSECRIHL